MGIFYTEQEKIFLGRYFKYIREKENIKISVIFNQFICGHDTYYKIEQGQVIKNDEIYDKLIHFFQITFKRQKEIDEQITPLFSKLYISCYYKNQEQVKQVITEIEAILNPYQDDIYYKEIKNSLTYLKTYYVNQTYLNYDEICDAIRLSVLFNQTLSFLLIETCEISNYNHVMNDELLDTFFPLLHQHDPILKYWYAKQLLTKGKYLDALNVLLQLENKFEDDNCDARLIKVLTSLYKIYQDLNIDEANVYETKILKCVQSEKLMNQIKQSSIHSIAMQYYLKGNFVKAMQMYQKAWEFYKSMSTLLYYCSCSSRLDYPIEIDLKNEINSSSALAPFLYFYQIKQQKYEEKKLEDYILNEMIQSLKLQKHRLPFWDMFDFEMRKLTKLTHNYKKYHLYLELQDKTIK